MKVIVGDSRLVLAELEPHSVGSCVTDPPYHLTNPGGSRRSNLEQSSEKDLAPVKAGAFRRLAKGFMGQQWDGGDVAHDPDYWREVYRVLKPGSHLAAFAGTRTYHRLACAIEDAGFEIRDQLAWGYGSGFPKSLDFARDSAASKEAGERIVLVDFAGHEQAEGWGTALKPAWEPICLARKPLSEKSIAANVLKWGTGALNIDGCRIEGMKPKLTAIESDRRNNPILQTKSATNTGEMTTEGRWPANLCHDGSDEVVAGFPNVEGVVGALHDPNGSLGYHGGAGGAYRKGTADSGSAARFFYCAKAGKLDRLGSDHPTVKPVALMRWLCRLVTPPGGLILDPFAGSGSTGVAAFVEGFDACLIELREEAAADIRRRLDHMRGLGRTTALEIAALDDEGKVKARGDDLPLFGAAL